MLRQSLRLTRRELQIEAGTVQGLVGAGRVTSAEITLNKCK